MVLTNPTRVSAATCPSTALQLTLLGSFSMANGDTDEALDLPVSVQRLVALLALRAEALHRAHVAGTLWPESSDDHAAGSLRSALWRARQSGHDIVAARGERLELAAVVTVDLAVLVDTAHRLGREQPVADIGALVARFDQDLLPDWYDDWVVVWRERWRHLRLHALESLASRLAAEGRFGLAVEAGLAAVRAEPLRESAHRALIAVHVLEGNEHEAIRQYQSYRDLLDVELQLRPSPLMESVIAGLTAR